MPTPNRTGMIGVALGVKTTAEALDALHAVAAVADVAEIRLDLMAEFDLTRLLEARPCPVVVTYRPEREGGRYGGSEEGRITVLRQAIELGAEFVDVELDTVGRLGERRGTGVIVSSHDFAGMPADFAGRWRAIKAAGADVVKLVGMAHQAHDAVPVLETLARADLPTIAIAMGEAGLPTRVLGLKYDACLLTYCALGTAEPVAPGQLAIADLREVYRGDRIGPETAVYGLIGPGIETDRARAYNAGLAARGLDAVAVPLVVPEDGDAAETIAAFRAIGVRGYQVHPPHQETVGQALDALDPSACRTGKVNTVYTGAAGDGSRTAPTLVGAWVETPAEQLDLWAGRGLPVGRRR